MSTLALREVVKHFASDAETIRAVDGVSLTVSAGEFVALYGPSGSGKTTLLMLAAALSSPDSGSVSFDGRELARMSAREAALYRRRDVGFVFQAFHLMAHTSALDNATIKLTGDGCTLREGRRRALPWLERVGLGGRMQHTPEQLSMGERQRVAIARALANEPRLLLADEPTGNLDSRSSADVLAMLDELHRSGRTIVLITHEQDVAEAAERILRFRDGRFVGQEEAAA
ncbi:MAG TPA: ABC transporter ATP-binding protein [Solirubrobacteraceae bacterium]|nr:ABC transporter ATP-binding protein [Solirubrobacteraceae bacterium]